MGCERKIDVGYITDRIELWRTGEDLEGPGEVKDVRFLIEKKSYIVIRLGCSGHGRCGGEQDCFLGAPLMLVEELLETTFVPSDLLLLLMTT